ncbi:MAG: substrate-binding domain-containing protein [Geminicoccaceae bacterium]
MTRSTEAYLTVGEVAALLRLKERRIYALVRSGAIPARRVTGRLLFAREELTTWLAAREAAVPAEGPPAVLVGSHDPLLDWALRESGSGLASFCDGSLDGLARMARGEAVAAGLHLSEPDGGWNVAHVREHLPQAPVVLLQWAWRERGLIVPAGNPMGIAAVTDLAGRRLVARQERAGSQLLLERLLHQGGVTPGLIAEVARSEADAALAVADGKGDAAFGLACMARQYRLGFVPLIRERFDLALDRRGHFEPPLQRLIRFSRSGAFVRKAGEMGGYDLGRQWEVEYNAP